MITACCVAAAVWCAVPGRPRGRWRRACDASATRPPLRPDHLVLALCPLLGFVLGGVPGLLGGVVLAPAAAAAVRRMEPARRRRERLRLADQLPFAVELLVAALGTGVPLRRSIAAVASAMPEPMCSRLSLVARRLAVAGDDAAVWNDLAGGPLAPLARALLRAERHGIPVAAVLQDSARELRRERQAARRDAARRVAVRTAAPLGACFLPAFFLVGIVPMLVGAFRSISWW